jgi:hypothetical protein
MGPPAGLCVPLQNVWELLLTPMGSGLSWRSDEVTSGRGIGLWKVECKQCLQIASH